MRKHINTPPKTLFGQERSKDTQILHFLQAVPHLEFTETGLANVAKRFSIPVSDLKARIAEFEAREGQSS